MGSRKVSIHWQSKIRPPVKYHGGKFYLARRIILLFPEHETYLEPFGGAASVLLNKPRSKVEVYNDLDVSISRLFRVLRDHSAEFLNRIESLQYCETSFVQAGNVPSEADDLELAVRDFVRRRMSRGGLRESFSWSTRLRGRRPGDLNAWETMKSHLPLVCERLQGVQIFSKPAIEILEQFESPESLVYCDPPYLHSTRAKSCREAYGCEMTMEDHKQLAECLNASACKIILSGYPSDLYTQLYSGWRCVSWDMPNHASNGRSKARKTESVWLNF